MRPWRRRRFEGLVARQLELFAEDEAELLREAAERDAAWTSAPAERAEELYGEYQDVVDAIGERLYDVREAYAATLGERQAAEYRAAFDRAAVRRFRRYAAFLEAE
ncbi:MAG TPA: hypothetical protein VNJ53_05855 [Gaiellaceae bacterium]|nr:hypothetical protein [Gaiellaceae bacterium]